MNRTVAFCIQKTELQPRGPGLLRVGLRMPPTSDEIPDDHPPQKWPCQKEMTVDGRTQQLARCPNYLEPGWTHPNIGVSLNEGPPSLFQNWWTKLRIPSSQYAEYPFGVPLKPAQTIHGTLKNYTTHACKCARAHTHTHTYAHTQREREREGDRDTSIYPFGCPQHPPLSRKASAITQASAKCPQPTSDGSKRGGCDGCKTCGAPNPKSAEWIDHIPPFEVRPSTYLHTPRPGSEPNETQVERQRAIYFHQNAKTIVE